MKMAAVLPNCKDEHTLFSSHLYRAGIDIACLSKGVYVSVPNTHKSLKGFSRTKYIKTGTVGISL